MVPGASWTIKITPAGPSSVIEKFCTHFLTGNKMINYALWSWSAWFQEEEELGTSVLQTEGRVLASGECDGATHCLPAWPWQRSMTEWQRSLHSALFLVSVRIIQTGKHAGPHSTFCWMIKCQWVPAADVARHYHHILRLIPQYIIILYYDTTDVVSGAEIIRIIRSNLALAVKN